MATTTLFEEKQHSEVKLCVIVPVKDEAEELEHTLNALYYQIDPGNRPLNKQLYEVLLLTNNCTDNSYQLALAYKQKRPEFNLNVADINLDPEIAHIGTVRRLLMDEAYNRFIKNNKSDGIIASTDGDSEVDKLWVHQIILAMSKGIDVVGGRIIPKATPDLSRLHHLQNVTYRHYVSRLETLLNPSEHDPWPRHFQCYGPSLAVTCDTYDKAGRLPILPFLEDEEFRKSLYRIDAKVRMCPSVKVYTSSRLVGKVTFGFSVQLQQWADMKSSGKNVLVENLSALIEKFELKHLLRNCWQKSKLTPGTPENLINIAERLRINPIWLLEEFKTAMYFGVLWEKVEEQLLEGGVWEKLYPQEPIEEAIAKFRNYFYGNKNANFKHIA